MRAFPAGVIIFSSTKVGKSPIRMMAKAKIIMVKVMLPGNFFNFTFSLGPRKTEPKTLTNIANMTTLPKIPIMEKIGLK